MGSKRELNISILLLLITISIIYSCKAEKDNIYDLYSEFYISDNTGLVSLSVSKGALDPAFDTNILEYTVYVDKEVNSISIKPALLDEKASIKINGIPAVSGIETKNIELVYNENIIAVTVTAEDGITEKTYTIVVNRRAPDSNADLSGLAVSEGEISPGFSSDLYEYTVTVENEISSISFTPVTSSLVSQVSINGLPAFSDMESSDIDLVYNENTIAIVVTAEDMTTANTYTIIVDRQEPEKNAFLSGISISEGELDANFDRERFGYSAEVNNSVSYMNITAYAEGGFASFTVNTIQIEPGTPSHNIELGVGSNTITILVTAEDQSTKIHTQLM